jgi:uncharacterized protein with GYD domain
VKVRTVQPLQEVKQKRLVANLLYSGHGKYVGVGILEAPNDEAAIEFGIRIGRLGNIRTTTLKAFTEEEIARVVDKLG